MKQPSLLAHLQNILILPFTVTVIVPMWLYNGEGVLCGTLVGWIAGTILSGGGLLLLGWTVYLFRVFGRGTLAPWQPTQKLVVQGPYRHCRNPMISGVFFILLGEACFLASWSILYWAAGFFLINHTYFILKEEPDLKKRFGKDYEMYKRLVPRWLPRWKAYTA